MSKTHIDINHLANLARINLESADAERFRDQIESILGYIDQLQTIDTSGVEETAQVTGLINVFREDQDSRFKIQDSEKLLARREVLLVAASDRHKGFVKVPVVLAEE